MVNICVVWNLIYVIKDQANDKIDEDKIKFQCFFVELLFYTGNFFLFVIPQSSAKIHKMLFLIFGILFLQF